MTLGELHTSLDPSEYLPENLHDHYEKLLKQLGIGDFESVLASVVAVLALAHEPLDEGELHAFLAHRKLLPADESGQSFLARCLAALASMLKTAPDPDGDPGFVLFRNSFRDYVRESRTMAITVRQTREALADLAEAETTPVRLERYLLRCGIPHLLESERTAFAERNMLNIGNLGKMAGAGVGWLPVYRWWMALGGEERALGYLQLLDAGLDWDEERQVAGIALLLEICLEGYWFQVGVPFAEAVVEIREHTLGSEHPDTLVSLNNLANILSYKGDLAGAEPIYRRVLEAMDSTLGPEHPATLGCLNRYANLLKAKGDISGAEPIYRRVLEARERTLGAEHPSTLGSLNSFANLLSAKGYLSEAEPIYRRALEAMERTLGSEHPYTLGSLTNLALLLKDKGDLSGAEPIYRRVQEARERALGVEHPYTLGSLTNLSLLLKAKGDLSGAESIYRRVFEARNTTLARTPR